MICVPISTNSRGSSAFTLPCVPTGMNTGVSMTPCFVVSRPNRAWLCVSVFRSSNIGSLTFQKSSTPHPIRRPVRPGSDEVIAAAQTVAVTAGRVDMEFRRNLCLFQGKVVVEHILDPDTVILRHHQECWRGIGGHVHVRRDFISVFLDRQVARVNQDAEIRPAT